MIPKVIHYCWFGGSELPESVKKCIESWRRVMPDYEIKRWDESNYKIDKCKYMKDAYAAKKYAFVSDYARLDILYNHGGIYLDTDVETLKAFDDLLKLDGFCGFEQGKKKVPNEVNTGLVLGARKHLEILKTLRDEYNQRGFDTTPCTTIQTQQLLKMGLKLNNQTQTIKSLTIFPDSYFCPMNQYTGETTITKNTYSVHHYAASWNLPVDQERRLLRMKYSKYGKIPSEILSTLVSYRKHYGIIKMWLEIWKKIK